MQQIRKFPLKQNQATVTLEAELISACAFIKIVRISE